MKVRIGRDELLTGLQRVQGVVEKRNTMPILSNILLEAKQDGVEIVATDLNQPMLDRAAAVGTRYPVEWRQADAMQLPFDDASFAGLGDGNLEVVANAVAATTIQATGPTPLVAVRRKLGMPTTPPVTGG